MDSGKNQHALIPGKSIFKDMALEPQYREISASKRNATLLARIDDCQKIDCLAKKRSENTIL